MYLWLFCLLAIISQIRVQDDDDDDEKCPKLFKTLIHPSECCNYPSRHILPSHQEKCKKSCEKIPDKTGGCCIIDCIYHKTGVLADGKFKSEALLELYENHLTEKGAGKFDQWMPIVESSIEKCLKLVNASKKIFVCGVPQHVLDVMDCVESLNFNDCPNFKLSQECQLLKKFTEESKTCGKIINGTFVIDYRFFDLKESE